MFFEVFHKDIPLDIVWYVLKSGADFTIKDEVSKRIVGR